ncbi:hypothetical protein B0H13DRAFT_2662335 [Mycena leptocephala]|nr:hypothetical protein B0H13DRAFT_2662335 [Mycena leptocephala]
MPRTHCRPKLKYPWVYVGNLNAKVDDAQLYTHFRVCGRVRDVQIRYSGGKSGSPGMGFRYAVVRFWSRQVSHAALQLNRTCVRGFPTDRLAVRAAIVELPETESLRRVYVDGETPAEVQPSGLHTASGACPTPMAIVKTVVWEPIEPAARTKAQGKQLVVGGVKYTMTRT